MAPKLNANMLFFRGRWPAVWQCILSLAAVALVLAPAMPAENSKASPMNVNSSSVCRRMDSIGTGKEGRAEVDL